MSRIQVTNDKTGETHLAEYWISQKGNLCWRLGGSTYAKTKSGSTTMLLEGQSSWVPSDYHTVAKAPMLEVEAPKSESASLRLIL